jgi:hypothetical protein
MTGSISCVTNDRGAIGLGVEQFQAACRGVVK